MACSSRLSETFRSLLKAVTLGSRVARAAAIRSRMSSSAGVGVELGAEHAVGVDGDAGGACQLLLLEPASLCPNRRRGQRHDQPRRQKPDRPTAESTTTHGYHLQSEGKGNCPVRSHADGQRPRVGARFRVSYTSTPLILIGQAGQSKQLNRNRSEKSGRRQVAQGRANGLRV